MCDFRTSDEAVPQVRTQFCYWRADRALFAHESHFGRGPRGQTEDRHDQKLQSSDKDVFPSKILSDAVLADTRKKNFGKMSSAQGGLMQV